VCSLIFNDNIKIAANSISDVISMINKSCNAAVDNAMFEIAKLSKKNIIRLINSRDIINSGLLKSSIRIYKVNNSEYRVGPDNNVKYAIFPELGTGIYNKNGRKGGWLYKADDGNWYFTYGQKPRYFMRDAAKSTADDSVYIIFLKLRKELKKNVNKIRNI